MAKPVPPSKSNRSPLSPGSLRDRRELASLVRRARVLLFLLGGIVLLGFLAAPRDTLAQTNKSRTAKARVNGAPIDLNSEFKEEQAAPAVPPAPGGGLGLEGFSPEKLVSPEGITSTINMMLMLTLLTLAPSIFIMSTCFIRFIIVLGLLRQALGTQQLPPNQVIVSLSLFLAFTVMSPVWTQSYQQGIRPYTSNEEINLEEGNDRLSQTFVNTVRPLRRFMFQQIDHAQNTDSLAVFINYQRNRPGFVEPETYEDVSIWALMPAFMLSELKTAFTIGFVIYLPFVIIDMVIASVLISMGMMMLPPVLISLPFKLLLFVLIDGWTLTVGMLLKSVAIGETATALVQTALPFV